MTVTSDPGMGPHLAEHDGRVPAMEPDADELWKTLNRARANPVLLKTLAAGEDAVFEFYLPFARALAVGHPAAGAYSVAATQASEVALAEAVLAWRYRDGHGFQRFAGLRIQAQLKAVAARRSRSTVSGPPE